MTTYYRTTTSNPVTLKLENEEMYVWEDGQWEESFYWWDVICVSGFTAYREITPAQARQYIRGDEPMQA